MKKTLNYILTLMLVLIAVSCEKGFMKNETFEPLTPELSFDGENSIVIDKTGGEFSFSFKSNLPWIIENTVDWIHVEGKDRGPGSEEPINIKCIVEINKSLTPRSTTIKVRIDDEHQEMMKITQLPMNIEDLGNDIYVKVDGTGDGSSWAKATTLSQALLDAMDGTIIHVAAGTYKPENLVRNISDDKAANKTFELMVNATIIGGYPADASDGAVADPALNKVILTGSGTQYRVLVVSAIRDKNFTATVDGVTITEGAGAGSPQLEINGARIRAGYGAGISVAGSNFILRNSYIISNKGVCGPAMYNSDGANTLIDNCIVSDNKSTKNGANIWSSYATLTIKNSQLLNNGTSGGVGGAVYIYGDSKNSSYPNQFYCYNTLFQGNYTDASRDSRRGAGVYAREGSTSVIANCTFTGNVGGDGGAIALYGTADRPSNMSIINCTITKNESKFEGSVVHYDNTTLKIYNSIISGNTAQAKPDVKSVNGNVTETFCYSICGSDVYGKQSQVTGGCFNAETMFAPMANNVFRLIGDNNPAKTMGMPVNELISIMTGLEPEVDYSLLAKDQNGVERTGTVIGASVE